MISATASSTKKIEFNFGKIGKPGLKGILYGKGLLFSLTYFGMMSLFIIMLFFLLPLKIELDFLFFRIGIILACFGLSYMFIKSLTEIVLGEDNIQFVIFRKYRIYLIETIRKIRVYYFTLWGLGAIYLKTENGSDVFFILAPNFQRERYNLFFKFVECLQENPNIGRRVKFKS